jgi:hypothetical protein
LADGDVIRIGSEVITFHTAADFGATDTQIEDTTPSARPPSA